MDTASSVPKRFFYLVIFQPGAGNLPRAALSLRFDLQAEQSLILLNVLSKQLTKGMKETVN